MQAETYGDILHLSRPVPARRPMPPADRAAQFSPFAALVGLDSTISHVAQASTDEIEFSQYADELLEWQLQIIQMQEESSWD